jgi:hypothetical protein
MKKALRYVEHSGKVHTPDLSCFMLANCGTTNLQAYVILQKYHYHHYYPLDSLACSGYNYKLQFCKNI